MRAAVIEVSKVSSGTILHCLEHEWLIKAWWPHYDLKELETPWIIHDKRATNAETSGWPKELNEAIKQPFTNWEIIKKAGTTGIFQISTVEAQMIIFSAVVEESYELLYDRYIFKYGEPPSCIPLSYNIPLPGTQHSIKIKDINHVTV